MKILNCLFATLIILFISSYSFAKNIISDTTIAVKLNKPTEKEVKLINTETPIIIRKGEKLTIQVTQENHAPATIRVHSSLGRLVQTFTEVWEKVTMSTDKLLPGVYLIVIKKDESREVRKVLITD